MQLALDERHRLAGAQIAGYLNVQQRYDGQRQDVGKRKEREDYWTDRVIHLAKVTVSSEYFLHEIVECRVLGIFL